MTVEQITALAKEIFERKLMFIDMPSCKFEFLSEVELAAVLAGLELLCKNLQS